MKNASRRWLIIWAGFGAGFLFGGWGMAFELESALPLVAFGLVAAFCFALAYIEIRRVQ